MKTPKILSPLAVVIAAALASSGAYAFNFGSDADASITDSQDVNYNTVNNQMTVNNAKVKDGSITDVSGNAGVNVVAGDNNQQANAAALASADASFVFGSNANATIDVNQNGNNNLLNNVSVPNTASLNGSLYNTSGNIGVNIAAGNYNQQKNDMAAAVAGGSASASAGVSQTLSGNTTNNAAQIALGEVAKKVNVELSGTYEGNSAQSNDVYPEVWSGGDHPGGDQQIGHIDFDNEGSQPGRFEFAEQGDLTLSGSVTSINTVITEIVPVTNNATLSNALYSVSGNVGVNIAAGGGNQQANALSIAAACNVCGSTTPGLE
ncbi:hypothetical protein ACF8C6_06985 [Pseudomonas sp. zbq_18]|uniref:hypothetical protein n=1 Tax=Pseudomonas sp. zbq_18 TaxID=3367251 RepID=UPI00370A83DE